DNGWRMGRWSWSARPGGRARCWSPTRCLAGERPAYKGRFLSNMAWLPSVWHLVGDSETHDAREESHAWPCPCGPMAAHSHAASAPVAQAPSARLGLGEPGHGARPLVCPDGRECYRGGGGGAERTYETATVARVGLRGSGPTGQPPASPPGRD